MRSWQEIIQEYGCVVDLGFTDKYMSRPCLNVSEVKTMINEARIECIDECAKIAAKLNITYMERVFGFAAAPTIYVIDTTPILKLKEQIT